MPKTPRPKSPRPDKRSRPGRPEHHGKGPGGLHAADDPVRLFGIHAVEAALRNRARVIHRILATDNAAHRLAESIGARGLSPEPTTPRDLDRMLGADTVHQGVLIDVAPLPEPDIDQLAEAAAGGGPLVLLDQVTDPHNVGAILRSAAVFGASGVVMTRRNSPPLGGVLAKSASGALELVPVALVQNLARTMTELKEAGVILLGLDGTAGHTIESQSFAGPVALVLGAEGRGLRQLTAESCDRLVRISTAQTLASLNVSNAAAVALHAALIARERSQ